ncbi:radical SAM protein [Streptomyces sp. NPDC005931]|uniref:radical SAM protein n=1 Tax=Streptomyces sp. NPDC005931 TaxID=3364737 RepID=UPI0036AC379D
MNICLISPPTVTEYEDASVAENRAMQLITENAPVGVLSLAAVLEQNGNAPEVVDLNRWYYEYLRAGYAEARPQDFCDFAVQRLELMPAHVYGFSTICSSYPLTLRIAERIKHVKPDAAVVLGGPQASVVDVPTLQRFEYVDYVVRGEAEETLPLLLDAMETGGPLGGIPGITFRQGGETVRNPNPPVIQNLDDLPMPAFHLYPHVKECGYVPLELGRGCPFACEFCSTNDFFRRRFRLKSPDRVIEQMKHIHAEYAITAFDLVHDMFTVDRRKVVDFCEALLASGEDFNWSCSARTDCIDDDLIALMHRAGCRGIFFGIETGSPRLQKIVKKRIDLDEAVRRIECADRHGIKTAASLITGFPEETVDDLRGTVAFLMDVLRLDHVEPQLHLLAPLAETPIQRRYADQLTLDDMYSDMSHQGWHQSPADRHMIESYPDVFPNFYTVPTPWLDKRYLKELREFVHVGMRRFRWLLVALHQDSGDLLTVFDAWLDRHLRHSERKTWSGPDICAYYAHPRFRAEFLEFLQADYLSASKPAHRTISEMVRFETALAGQEESAGQVPGTREKRDGVAVLPDNEVIRPEAVPFAPESVRGVRLAVDYPMVIARLKEKGSIAQPPTAQSTLVRRMREDGEAEYIALSPLSAQLWELCDGSRSVREISGMFAESSPDTGGIDPVKGSVFGLGTLRRQGLLHLQADRDQQNRVSDAVPATWHERGGA